MIKLAVFLILLAAGAATAAELRIGDGLVTRRDTLKATLRLDAPRKGPGRLTLTWTDSYGRTVAVETRRVRLNGNELPVALPLARAVALQNFLAAELTVGDAVVGAPKAEFIVTPESPEWDDYQIIMYYAYKARHQPALRDVGITAGKVSSGRTQRADGGRAWYAHDYRFYCDQISTSFYAAYHTPAQKPKNRMLKRAKAAYKEDRTSKKPFFRRPCLHDEAALAKACQRLATAVRMQKRLRPFFYAHTDEGGVADLVAAWDFCFDPRTLAAMRKWLIEQYGSLAGINRQWGTDFKRLEDVVPLSTDEMMARGDNNFSAWADHRFFMNKAFADALAAGTRAVEKADPAARAGLVGCQMPAAFGGYDYWLLSRAMTAIEPYNIGNNREIWRSFVPDAPAVTTAFGFGDMEVWRLWYQFLHGDRGIIIYDEKSRYLTADGKPTQLGAAIAPTYKELTGGLRKQLYHMQRVEDPIAIHYSHPSITAHWMLEVRPSGKRWVNRSSGTERKTSPFLRLRVSCTKLIEDNGRQYDFVAYAQLENGEFDKMPAKVLLLPQSIAMSAAECQAVRRFVKRGGTVIADCRTALMDAHCKMLEKGQLDDLFGIERKDLTFAPGKAGLKVRPEVSPHALLTGDLKEVSAAEPGVTAKGAAALYQDARGTPAVIVKAHGKGRTIYLNAVITDYHRWRLRPPEAAALRKLMGAACRLAGVQPQVAVSCARRAGYAVELHPYRGGDMRILALHRNYQLRVSELGPPAYRKQDALAGPMKLKVALGGTFAVYDQRAGKLLGKTDAVTVALDQYQPTILTLLPEPVEEMTLSAPAEAARGTLVRTRLKLVAPKLGKTHAFRVRVLAPDGKELRVLTRTLSAPGGAVAWEFPLALTDPAGSYALHVRDVATGARAEARLSVR